MAAYLAAVVVPLIMLIVLAGALWGPILLYRETPSPKGGGAVERYGPPPGMYRAPALHGRTFGLSDLPANTASAILHGIEGSIPC